MKADLSCRVWWDEAHQVVRQSWAAGAACRLPEVRAATRATAELGRGPVLVLVDARRLARIDQVASHHFRRPGGAVTAVAGRVDSAVNRIIDRVITALLDTVPAGMFADEHSTSDLAGHPNSDETDHRENHQR